LKLLRYAQNPLELDTFSRNLKLPTFSGLVSNTAN